LSFAREVVASSFAREVVALSFAQVVAPPPKKKRSAFPYR
jgi:hypothetical protein